MSDLVKRTYRIKKSHDKHVKKQRGGESNYVRTLIEKELLAKR